MQCKWNWLVSLVLVSGALVGGVPPAEAGAVSLEEHFDFVDGARKVREILVVAAELDVVVDAPGLRDRGSATVVLRYDAFVDGVFRTMRYAFAADGGLRLIVDGNDPKETMELAFDAPCDGRSLLGGRALFLSGGDVLGAFGVLQGFESSVSTQAETDPLSFALMSFVPHSQPGLEPAGLFPEWGVLGDEQLQESGGSRKPGKLRRLFSIGKLLVGVIFRCEIETRKGCDGKWVEPDENGACPIGIACHGGCCDGDCFTRETTVYSFGLG